MDAHFERINVHFAGWGFTSDLSLKSHTSTMADQILCKSCKQWNSSSDELCYSCGSELHLERKEREKVQIERSETQKGWDVPVIKIKPSYPWFVKPFLYVARAIQLAALAIGGALAWSAFWASA